MVRSPPSAAARLRIGGPVSQRVPVVLITGASRGIGRATALAMARAGAQIVAAARTEDQLRTLAQEIEAETGGPVLPCVADVARETDVKRMIKTALEAFGRVDVLVNNAGVRTSRAPLWEVSTELSITHIFPKRMR